ncbi:MAG: hypothetical protein AAB370_10035 [Verrucomicrobiota bacterium]
MSEFKFACPVCGQHITCDAGSSGTQMDCPTCFRKLVVPQAPASGSKNFVLTAAAAQTRKIPLPSAGQTRPVSPPATKIPVALIVLGIVICAAGAGAFIFRGKLFSSSKPEGSAETNALVQVEKKSVVPVVLLPPSTNWTLNLADAKIPDAPASGSVMGRAFTIERAVIQGGKLDLRQGPKWPPDVGVSIHLFAERAEELAGKTVVLESTRTNAPRVILRWKEDQDKAVTKEFRKGYAARVEFGPVTNSRLNGKIYLATADDAKSYAAGTFSAEIRKPAPPKK